MDIIIDGTTQFTPTQSHDTVLSLLGEINERLRQEKRGLLRVLVDGEDVLADDATGQLGEMPCAEASKLEITTGLLKDLVSESIDEILSALPDLPDVCHALAEIFQGEDPDEGYDAFDQLAGIWGYIKEQQLLVASTVGIDVDTFKVGEQTLEALSEKLNEFLLEASQALENNDAVLLGDLLEYELAPLAEMELDITEQLKAAAEKELE